MKVNPEHSDWCKCSSCDCDDRSKCIEVLPMGEWCIARCTTCPWRSERLYEQDQDVTEEVEESEEE